VERIFDLINQMEADGIRTDLMRQLARRKVAWRKQLAARPVGEKLRMLEEMVAETKAISATRPPGPANPVRGKARSGPADPQ
jgi:hypothetical protein